MSRGYSDPPRHDRSESTYSYWHPFGYGSSESIAYDRNSCRAGRPFLRDLLDSTVQGGNRLCWSQWISDYSQIVH